MGNVMRFDDPKASPKARGKRLQRLRKMVNLTRADIEYKYPELKAETFKAWELGRFNGISMKGAKKAIPMLEREGVKCSLDWLMYEIGVGPQLFQFDPNAADVVQEPSAEAYHDDTITQELSFFRQLHQESIDFVVEDDAMLPCFKPGDYVAGIKCYSDQIETVVGADCIMQTRDGKLLFRYLHSSNSDGTFNLRCKNPETTVQDYALNHVVLISAAPVIWLRCKNIYKNQPA